MAFDLMINEKREKKRKIALGCTRVFIRAFKVIFTGLKVLAGHSSSHKEVNGEPHSHAIIWHGWWIPGGFSGCFRFYSFFTHGATVLALVFFSCLFFLFPGSYLTSSFSLLSPFIQFISKVDKTGRCNGNQWQWENKRGYYLGSGKCFFFFFFFSMFSMF